MTRMQRFQPGLLKLMERKTLFSHSECLRLLCGKGHSHKCKKLKLNFVIYPADKNSEEFSPETRQKEEKESPQKEEKSRRKLR